ncbi:hypothetical protein ACFPYI_17790 [Halomarina salina]|uniref:Uncharacterized protein n=1 Tax=Halomarina salina TaxID=1872699 RepID=A0ABD5RRN6_9EURY|nr:hypothetical protein [Halomarina salina]
MRRVDTLVLSVGVVVLTLLAGGIVLGMVGVTPPFVGEEESDPRPAGEPSPGAAAPRTNTTGTAVRTFSDAGQPGPAVATAPATPEAPRYDVNVTGVESCGPTCRDVTASLTNLDDEPRENVTAVIRVYADGRLLWTGRERVGTLEPGATHTTTKRVELTYVEALAVETSGGYVTIETTIRSDSGAVTYSERRRVS